MYVDIYYFGQLAIARDEVEEALEESLLQFGGESAGTGAGETGGNFDFEVSDDANIERVISALTAVLHQFDFPANTKIRTASGEHLLGETNL